MRMSGKAEDAGAENMQSENMRQDDMRAENAGLESGAAAKLTCGVSVAGVNAACGGSNAKPAAENARAESDISAKKAAAKKAAAKNAAAESNAGAGEDAESAAGPAAEPDSVSGVSGRSPRLRFAGFTQPWQTRKLEEICEKITRKNKNNESDLPLTIASQYGLIDQRDFFNKIVASKDMSNYYLLKKGEFAYNKSYSNGFDYGSIKRLNDYEQGCLSTLYICFGLVSDDVDSDYLECYFDTLRWYENISLICAEGARNHGLLNVNTKAFFEDVTVWFPSDLEEQRQIGMFFSGLDRIIRVQERKTEALRLSKKYFLQNMFPRRGESAPRLRFVGFAEPWQTRKLGEMVSVQSGKDYKSLNEGDVPVYGTGGYMLSVSEALSYSEDAIGIGRKGTIDKPFVLRAPFWTVDTLFYCVPKENYDLDFVNVVFQNVNWRVLDESTGVPSLSKKIINEVKAKVPSVGEQRQIGMFFSGLDRIISVQERKTELLRQAKKYYLQNMFA